MASKYFAEQFSQYFKVTVCFKSFNIFQDAQGVYVWIQTNKDSVRLFDNFIIIIEPQPYYNHRIIASPRIANYQLNIPK